MADELPRRSETPGGRVLVVGANGFLGRAIVRAFRERGREVRGLVRDPSRSPVVEGAGGIPMVGDILAEESLHRASEGCDTIVHVATDWSREDQEPGYARRVRVEGAQKLVAAARSNDVRRLVIGSGYWVYPDTPGTITEASPVDPQGEALVNYEAERVGLGGNAPESLEAVVVRPGMVYGDGAWFRPVVDAIAAGHYRVIEGGTNRWSFVSLPDTGAGFVAAAEAGRAGEVYNLVDDRPTAWGEFATFVAGRMRCPPPPSISLSEAEAEFGPIIARHLRANRATSSAKLRRTGWTLRYPTYEGGVEAALRAMNARR